MHDSDDATRTHDALPSIFSLDDEAERISLLLRRMPGIGKCIQRPRAVRAS